MKSIYILTLFSMILASSTSAQDTFYKQYEFALEDDNEGIRYLYNIDDTLRLITLREVSAVGINFTLIDTNGEVISNVYHDDIGFFEEAIIYDEEKEEFIFDGISRRDGPNKNCIFRLDKYGNIIETKCNQYALPDDKAMGDVDNVLHLIKTDFGYVSSGVEFANESFYPLLNIYDHNLNLTFSDTIPFFRHLSNISYDGHSGINGIGLARNNFFIPLTIDSMFFLKIDKTGNINEQIRIPHTEGMLQLNGLYPFNTDTLTGLSYMVDKYDYDDGLLSMPRILKFDASGEVIWEFHNWKTYPRLRSVNIHIRENGDLIVHGAGTHYDVTTNGSSDAIVAISVDSNGNFLWDKVLYDLVNVDDEIEKRILYSRDITEDSEENIYLGAEGILPIVGEAQTKPFLIKLTPDGCYTPDCRTTVNMGNYHKPNNLVSERNEIHIFNKDTGHSYRYTFYRKNDIEKGGELLKSNSMSGDEDWYFAGRDFTGWGYESSPFGKYVKENYDFVQEIPDAFSDEQYRFGYEIGDEMRLEHPYTNDKEYLRVVNIEDITLLAGRTKKQFTLECQNLDPDGNPYPQRIWIEDIGDINDFLNTPYSCTTPGNEVITCFFSDGELIWQHPDYDLCTVATDDLDLNVNIVFPNPTQDFVKFDFAVQDYSIIDIYGHMHMSGSRIEIGVSIDVSSLASGTYIILGTSREGENLRQKLIKI